MCVRSQPQAMIGGCKERYLTPGGRMAAYIMNLQTSILFGAIFGLLSGACAFVIAYAEYKRNWSFTGNATAMALRSAVVTFLVFFLAAIVLPWIFTIAVGTR
jgi:hypothetical protein